MPSIEYGFWGKLKKSASASGRDGPFFVLAPMADVTDAAFRKIILETGRPDVFYTEFISAAGLASEKGRPRLIKNLEYSESEHPIVAQFFGSNPEHFRICAKLARERGFDGIDINMGCPDRKVIKQGAGIGLSKSPMLAKEIIAAAKEGAGDLPVSVKTRLGYFDIDLRWIEELFSTEIPVLILHGRTMKEMSKVPAHWDVISEVARRGKERGILVVGNGDVMSYQEGQQRAQESGVDGIMVGRGIFQNPWLFNPSIRLKDISIEQRLELLLKHTKLFVDLWGSDKSFDLMKKFYKIYIAGWDGAKKLRAAVMETKSEEEVRGIIQEYLRSSQ